MDVYGSPTPTRVYNTISMLTCDVPASRKARGHAGHSHKTQACDQCDITTEEFQFPKGCDIDSKRQILKHNVIVIITVKSRF
jgi:hypothetical protein